MKQLLLISAFLLCLAANAQPARYMSFNNLNGATQTLNIRALVQDSTRMIWMATDNDICSWDGYNLIHYSFFDGHNLGCVTCATIKDGDIILGCEYGMMAFNLKTHQMRQEEALLGEKIHCLAVDGNDIWIGTDGGVYKNYEMMKIDIKGVNSLLIDGDILYLGLEQSLVKYSLRHNSLANVNTDTYVVGSLLPSNTEGNVWVGSIPTLFNMNGTTGECYEQYYFPVIKALCLDIDGNILVGTDNGFYVLDKQKKIWQILHDARNGAQSLAGDVVYCLLRDYDDNIWIGTNNGISLSEQNNLITTYPLPLITNQSSGNQIYQIFRDSDGSLWMGGTHGIICVEGIGTDKQTSRWYKMDDPQYPLFHNRIRHIMEDSRHRLWVAIDAAILFYNRSTRMFKRFLIQEDAANWAYHIQETDEGDILITTYHGSYIIDGDSPFKDDTYLNVKKVLKKQKYDLGTMSATASNTIFSLTQDGLKVEDKNTGKEFNISTVDKYLSIYYDSQSNRLWLGGIDKIACINPNSFQNSQKSDIPIITNIEIIGSGFVDHEELVNSDITLNHDQNNLLFYFSDFNFNNEKNTHFSFSIVNMQKGWIPLRSGENTLLLSSLKPGTYTLLIRNNDSQDEELQSSITFTILSPWYLSTTAWIVYSLILILLVIAIILYIRQRRITRREREERETLLKQAKKKEEELLEDKAALENQLRLQLLANSENDGELSQDEHLLLRITKIIEENIDNPDLSVDFLSNKTGISQKQLYRKIKQLTDMTTVAYIRQLRLKKAGILLCNENFNIAEAMYMVGFSNASYFTKCFQEEYHQTPSEYQASHIGKEE